MKKSLLAVLLVAVLVLPAVSAFCEETTTQKTSQQEISTPVAAEASSEVSKVETEQGVKEEVQAEAKAETEAEVKTEVKAEVKAEDTAEPVVAADSKEKPQDTTTSSSGKKIFNYSKDTSRTEIEIKVGKTVNSKPEVDRDPVDVDSVYTIGIEVMAYSNSFIGFGAGIYNMFDSKIKQDGNTVTNPEGEEYEIAFTNPYLTLKSKILQFDSDIIRNVYIYGQIGYGFMRIKNAYETEDGMYWSVGAGIDIWHFLIDFNYATNFGKIKVESEAKKLDVRQSTLIVSLGYRFSL